MNIILRELRTSIKSLLIWCSVFAVLVTMYLTEFSAFANNDEMVDLLDSMPEGMMEAFRFNSFNMTTLTGFFGLLFTYFTLVLCIHAILKGNSIIAKEERDKTVEFTLVLPVRRSRIVFAKLIAAVVNCALILAFLYGFIIISIQKYLPEENFMKFFSLVILGTFITQMIFLSIGILLGCSIKQYKKSGYIGASIILITYIMTIFIDLNEKLDFLKYITPFKYFDTLLIKNELTLDWTYVIISLAVISVCLAIGFVTYRKRDLYI